MNVGKIIIKTFIDNKGFDDGMKQILKDAKRHGKQITNKINDTIKKGLQNALNTGKSLFKIIGKVLLSVAKIAATLIAVVAVVGLIAAGVFIISKAFEQVFKNNEQLKANLDYLKFAITQALQPAIDAVAKVIEKIVNFLIKMVQYIGYIISMWRGHNIFENASVDAYAKSLKKAEENQKALNKQTAKFDEMNILQDKSSGNNSSSTMPSMDWSQGMAGFQEGEVPGWIDWIAKHGEEVAAIITGIGTALIFLKVFGLDPLLSLGIGTILAGIVYVIEKILEYMNDPTWSTFGDILIGIGIIIAGIAVVVASIPVAIAAAIVLILGILAKFWDKISGWLDKVRSKIFEIGNNIMDWFVEKLGWLSVIINVVVGTIVGVLEGIIDTIETLLGGLFSSIRGILDGILMICNGNFKSGLWQILKSIINLVITVLNTLISALNTVISPIRALIVAIGKVVGKDWTMENIKIPKIPYLAKGAIASVPGKGIPTMAGNARWAEAGAEAYLPLTDEQVMSTLGQSIGKYITINANIVNTMNGRVISRELQTIQNESDFAFNR